MLIVKKCLESLPSATSVLCFDTLFHTTIPEHRTTYAISKPPHKTPVPLVRYGFHGLSYGSIVNQMADELSVPKDELNLVVAHLGSGGSCCLIQNGKSTNTTMGLTPLEGAIALPAKDRAKWLTFLFAAMQDYREALARALWTLLSSFITPQTAQRRSNGLVVTFPKPSMFSTRNLASKVSRGFLLISHSNLGRKTDMTGAPQP